MAISKVVGSTASGANNFATSMTISPFTTSANSLCVVCVATEGQTVTSITGGGLTWSHLASEPVNVSANSEVWIAYASGSVSAATITINFSASAWAVAVIEAFAGTAASAGNAAAGIGTSAAATSGSSFVSSESVIVTSSGHDQSVYIGCCVEYQDSTATINAGTGYTVDISKGNNHSTMVIGLESGNSAVSPASNTVVNFSITRGGSGTAQLSVIGAELLVGGGPTTSIKGFSSASGVVFNWSV